MGIWRGKAPLSAKGDWSHGPMVQLKFHSHGSKEKVSEANTADLGAAYSRAVQMVSHAKAVVALDHDENALLKKYFTDRFEWKHIYDVLAATFGGLRNNSKENRLYLYTKASKPARNDVGYVMSHSADDPDKQHRPAGSRFPYSTRLKRHVFAEPEEKKPTRQGHIHLNIGSYADVADLAHTIAHEATHAFAGTADFAYMNEPHFKDLTTGEAMNNADSYAAFCSELWIL
jgi:hypothetical protein